LYKLQDTSRQLSNPYPFFFTPTNISSFIISFQDTLRSFIGTSSGRGYRYIGRKCAIEEYIKENCATEKYIKGKYAIEEYIKEKCTIEEQTEEKCATEEYVEEKFAIEEYTEKNTI
jgi:hypothetical protein